MAVQIDVSYLGGLRTRARHEPSGATLETAAPLDNAGDGSSFSPTDLAAASLVSCGLTIMAITAKKHGVELDGARGTIEKHMSLDAPRRIARLPLTFHMPPGVPDELKDRLEHAAMACPVYHSLHEGIEIDLTFVWPKS